MKMKGARWARRLPTSARVAHWTNRLEALGGRAFSFFNHFDGLGKKLAAEHCHHGNLHCRGQPFRGPFDASEG